MVLKAWNITEKLHCRLLYVDDKTSNLLEAKPCPDGDISSPMCVAVKETHRTHPAGRFNPFLINKYRKISSWLRTDVILVTMQVSGQTGCSQNRRFYPLFAQILRFHGWWDASDNQISRDGRSSRRPEAKRSQVTSFKKKTTKKSRFMEAAAAARTELIVQLWPFVALQKIVSELQNKKRKNLEQHGADMW